jgi:hypothetical protein
MRHRTFVTLSLSLCAAALAFPLRAAAEDSDLLGDLSSYVRLASPKAELIARTVSLGARVDRAERRGDLSRSEKRRMQDRIRDIGDFLRNDRHLDRGEFRRRDRDLDRIERDLDRVERGGKRSRR